VLGFSQFVIDGDCVRRGRGPDSACMGRGVLLGIADSLLNGRHSWLHTVGLAHGGRHGCFRWGLSDFGLLVQRSRQVLL